MTKEQAEFFRDAIICENELFNQLSDAATAAADTLKKTPETEKVLTTVAALDMIRTTLKDMASGDDDRINTATKLLKEISTL